MPVRGVILAGGQASRYGGRPKGLERVGGERILDRLVAACIAALGSTPLLVANDPAAPGWRPDLAIATDVEPGLGALGGLLTAVERGPAPVVVVAWDMPFVTTSLLAALAAGLTEADVVIPEGDNRRGLEPLCAAYGPACGPAIRAALAAGDRRAIGFHDRVRVSILPRGEVARHGDPALLFLNVNEPADLQRADDLWRRASSPS